VTGQWFSNMIPVNIIGSGLAIQIFYFHMRRFGNGLCSDPDKNIPGIVLSGIVETPRSEVTVALDRSVETLGCTPQVQKIEWVGEFL